MAKNKKSVSFSKNISSTIAIGIISLVAGSLTVFITARAYNDSVAYGLEACDSAQCVQKAAVHKVAPAPVVKKK